MAVGNIKKRIRVQFIIDNVIDLIPYYKINKVSKTFEAKLLFIKFRIQGLF